MQFIEFDGVAARLLNVPETFTPGRILPEGTELYLSDQPGNVGNLYRWEHGRTTQLDREATSLLRERSLQYTTDQCNAQGWNYYENMVGSQWGHISHLSGNVRRRQMLPSRLNLSGRDVELRMFLDPPTDSIGLTPDQTLVIKLTIDGQTPLTFTLPHQHRFHSIGQEEWNNVPRSTLAQPYMHPRSQ